MKKTTTEHNRQVRIQAEKKFKVEISCEMTKIKQYPNLWTQFPKLWASHRAESDRPDKISRVIIREATKMALVTVWELFTTTVLVEKSIPTTVGSTNPQILPLWESRKKEASYETSSASSLTQSVQGTPQACEKVDVIRWHPFNAENTAENEPCASLWTQHRHCDTWSWHHHVVMKLFFRISSGFPFHFPFHYIIIHGVLLVCHITDKSRHETVISSWRKVKKISNCVNISSY